MPINYWVSQIIVVIAYIFLGIGLQKKEKLQILKFSSIYQLFMIIHFSLLFGISGMIASIIALFRNFLFMYNERKGKNNSIKVLISFGIIAIILTIIFYTNIADILPCILTLAGIYSYWAKSTKVTRIGNLIVSICYIIYAIFLNSWVTILCESYLIINTIIGYFKYDHNKKY